MLVFTAFNKVKEMVSAVREVDTAMTNLYKVTDETSERYNRFLETSERNAQKLGRSVSSLVEQTASWAKLGFNLDEAEQLAQISSIYANVGELGDEEAMQDLVTVIKSFKMEASEAITIVDILNKLGNEFATTSADLGEGLKNAASMLSMGGVSLQEASAMLAGGAEITQNAGELANALKIGQMRVQGKPFMPIYCENNNSCHAI